MQKARRGGQYDLEAVAGLRQTVLISTAQLHGEQLCRMDNPGDAVRDVSRGKTRLDTTFHESESQCSHRQTPSSIRFLLLVNRASSRGETYSES